MTRTRRRRDDPITRDRKRKQVNPSKRSGASAPDLSRVSQRPDPESWALDELLTLPEAAQLLWPEGPLTVTTLRTVVRYGELAVAVIAGKHFTTRRHLAVLTACKALAAPPAAEPTPGLQENRTLTIGEAREMFDGELSTLRYPRISQGR